MVYAASLLADQLTLNWRQCQGNVWCSLNNLNLSHSHFDDLNGVYIILHGGVNPAVVYVGQGNIRNRLSKHHNDQRVQQYKGLGLYVTWAKVATPSRNGVERYLAETLHPLIGDHFPDDAPIEVNLPW